MFAGKVNNPIAKTTVVIGISGPSGSGKTTVCQGLQELLSESTVLQQDLYFKPDNMLSEFDNFCNLDCLFLEEFVRDVISLTGGRNIRVPNLDLNTFKRLNGFKVFEPSGFLMIEGMTIFRISEIYPLFNYRFYLSPGIDEIRHRKTRRDLRDREKTREELEYQLSWVKEEYLCDLDNLPSGIDFVSGRFSVEQICQLIFKRIMEESDGKA